MQAFKQVGRTLTALNPDMIRRRFQEHLREADPPYVSYTAYHLLRWILDENEFDSLESLIGFCGDPGCLRSWLPDPVERVVVSLELVRILRELSSNRASLPGAPCAPIDSGGTNRRDRAGRSVAEGVPRRARTRDTGRALEESVPERTRPYISCG